MRDEPSKGQQHSTSYWFNNKDVREIVRGAVTVAILGQGGDNMDIVVPPIPKICKHEHTVSVRKNSRISQGSSGISIVPQSIDTASNTALWSAIVYLIEQQIPGCEHRPEIWFFGQGKRRLMMSWKALESWMKSKTIDKHSVSLEATVSAGGRLPKSGWETLHTGNDYTLRIRDLKLQLCVDRRDLEKWYKDGLVLPV